MAIRPDVPTDPAVLTEMVLALDAENDQLRTVVQTLKDMIFGANSEIGTTPARARTRGTATGAMRGLRNCSHTTNNRSSASENPS